MTTEVVTQDEETLLSELPQHPAWTGLKKIAAERKRLEFDRMVRQIVRGEDLSKEDIAYKRGYFDGLQYLFQEVNRIRRSEVSA